MRDGASYDTVYICDWLPPDFGAVGQYSQLFARQSAGGGESVALIGLTSGHRSDNCERHGTGHLRIIKVPVKRYDKVDRAARLVWTVKANTKLLLEALPLIRKAHRVVFTGSPPLFLHWIAPTNLILRKKLVYRITDFHPECAIAERGRPSLFLRCLLAVTLFWRRRVNDFEVLGHDQAARLRDIGIPASRIHFKPDPAPVSIPSDTQPLGRPPEARGKTLLLYSGNWGVAHDHRTFIDSYERHHRSGRGDVTIWLNAVGCGAESVEAALRTAHLPFIRSTPVPLDQLARLLVTPDVHLITLSDPFVGYVLPSKVHGCILSKQRVLFIGSQESDVHRLCSAQLGEHYNQVAVGDVERCAQILDDLGTALARHHPVAAAPQSITAD